MSTQNTTPTADSGRLPDVARYPALPGGMTRDEAIEGLWEIVSKAEEYQRDIDPRFRRWPDVDALIDYIEANGFPPPDNAKLSRTTET